METSAAPARFKLGWLWVIACALTSQGVRAHDFPTSFQVLFEPGQPERMVVALRPGLALTETGGASWNFLCGAVSGLAGSDSYAALIARDGHVLVATFTGVYRDDGLGCSWSALGADTGLPRGEVVSLSLEDDGSIRALTALPGIDNRLYVSHDHGQHWSARGAPLMAARPTSMVAAPGDSERLYASGVKTNALVPTLFVSRDDGQAWTEKALPSGPNIEVVAVDPTNSERVFFVRRASGGTSLPDTLLVSRDAGDHYEALFETAALGGVACSPDGKTIWVGSRSGGLFRSDDGAPFERIHDSLRVGCLQYHDDRLWVCARDQSGGNDPFALAASQDRGDTWQPVLRSDQLRRLRTCGNPEQARLCSDEWNQWKWDVFRSTREPPLIEADAGKSSEVAQAADAGSVTAAGAEQRATSVGSSCAFAPPKGRTRSWAVMLALVLVVGSRRRVIAGSRPRIQ